MVKDLTNKEPKRLEGVTRRRFLTAAGATGAAAFISPMIVTAGRAQASAVVRYADDGGTTFEIRKAQLLDPFQAEKGVEIVVYTGQKNLAKLKAMTETGNVEFDVVNELGINAVAAGNEGFQEPLDKSKFDLSRNLFPEEWNDYTYAWQLSANGVGYNAESLAGKPIPKTWAELWDVTNFPGRRGMMARPQEALEMALMADGVAPADRYPLDVDRAFAALDRIKPDIQIFINDTGKTIEHLQNKELDYTYTGYGRLYVAQQAGVPLVMIPELPLAGFQNLSIVKGARDYDASLDLVLWFAYYTEGLVNYFSQLPGSGPTDRPTFEAMPAELKSHLPDPSNPNLLLLSPTYWGEHLPELEERYKLWMLQ